MNASMQNLLHLFYDEHPLIIRHKSSMDVCFQIMNLEKTDQNKPINMQDAYKIIGTWINMGFTSSFPIQNETITITSDSLKEWEFCADPDVKCLRDAKWIKL